MSVRVINLNEVSEELGVSKQTLRRAWQAGRFPEPTRVTPRKLVWPADVIEDFLRGNDRPGVEEIQL